MEKLNIFNEVSGFRVPRSALSRVFERFLKLERVRGRFGVNLVFIGEKKMKELNEKWKGGVGATDVLSFNYGEIYICVPVARENALGDGTSVVAEILNLFAHGLLHLNGWTHETPAKYEKMMRKMREVVGDGR